MAKKALETFAPDTKIPAAAHSHAQDNISTFIGTHAAEIDVTEIAGWANEAKQQPTVGAVLTCLASCPNKNAAATYRAALQAELSRS
jgi:hypothetical protein